ncbi:hypothetical protein ACFQHO_35940 [Actinomadura yumaensis]|uniref:hypothetical protein n=1 Tax=Actinomadura TaxID=1988 RepID=UPI00132B31A4|nr:hypothetical protein [Actinomadura sp. J1-007]MWK32976.1 hypothetical protein [Actinomadura sp. J1-007]
MALAGAARGGPEDGTRRRWFTGLRARLAAAFTAVALLASVLASGISYVLLRNAMLQRAQDTVLAEVRQTLARQVPRSSRRTSTRTSGWSSPAPWPRPAGARRRRCR